MSTLLAFTLEHAARVTEVSERRIRYWDTTGVLSPSLAHDPKHRSPYGRIYSFRDLVGIRTLGQLRDGFDLPLQQLRRIGVWLNEQYDEPWSSLRFYMLGRGRKADVFFRDPSTEAIVSTRHRGQRAIPIDLEAIALWTGREANKLTERTSDQFGRIARNRYVLSNAPVIVGTRVPTAAVWSFHQAGHEVQRILREYPRLTPLDVEQAIAFEDDRRRQLAS